MNSGPIARRYANSLLDMAEEAKAVEAVESDIRDFLSMLEDSADLRKLVTNPLFSAGQKKEALAVIAGKAKFHELTGKFLGVLVENRRLFYVEEIMKTVLEELSNRRGEIRAKVETAQPLTKEQETKLRTELSKKLGADISLHMRVNEDLMGGMKVIVGSRLIDNSVKAKLERLQIRMGGVEKEAA